MLQEAGLMYHQKKNRGFLLIINTEEIELTYQVLSSKQIETGSNPSKKVFIRPAYSGLVHVVSIHSVSAEVEEG